MPYIDRFTKKIRGKFRRRKFFDLYETTEEGGYGFMLKALKAFRGGIKLDSRKYTKSQASARMPIAPKIVIPMQQHIGAPCKPIVKKGDAVLKGQIIAIPADDLSPPVHASCSGTVSAVGPKLYAGGRHAVSIVIETDEVQQIHPDVRAVKTRDPDEMIDAIRQSGLVGQGGPGYPTWHKLKQASEKNYDTLIVNGAECEPYLTSDFREMVENPDGILKGIDEILHMTGIKRTIIAIEDDKMEAITAISEALGTRTSIEIVKLRTRYPQGSERQLVFATTGQTISSGETAASSGILVLNVSTVAFVHQYLETGMPMIERRITVAGAALNQAQNVIVPIGTLLTDLFDFVGGFKEPPTQVIMGGPMSGIGQFTLDNTILKQTTAILAFTVAEADTRQETACIRCARCVRVCPMNLMPLDLNAKIMQGKVEEAAEKYHLMDCIECGACSYICPSARNLVQSFRLGKAEIRAQAMRQQKLEVGDQHG